MRLVIVGGPRTGKTTAAGEHAIHTDDFTGDFSQQSATAAKLLGNGPGVMEGVTAVRALRKWLVNNPEGKPCDRVVGMWESKVSLSPGQQSLAKGCDTVWKEIEPELRKRGVVIE